jgi:hypothetical protein
MEHEKKKLNDILRAQEQYDPMIYLKEHVEGAFVPGFNPHGKQDHIQPPLAIVNKPVPRFNPYTKQDQIKQTLTTQALTKQLPREHWKSCLPTLLLQQDPISHEDHQPNSTTSSHLQLQVVGTCNNALVIIIRKPNGDPPFVRPIVEYLSKNAKVRAKLGLAMIDNLRHPDHPDQYHTIRNKKGYDNKTIVLVRQLTGPDQAINNNATVRREWATMVCAFWNHPTIQAKFTWPELLVFSADLTPQDQSTAQPLGHWLTTRKTLDYIVNSFKHIRSISDILAQPELLVHFFSAEMIPEVITQFSQFANQTQFDLEEDDTVLDF